MGVHININDINLNVFAFEEVTVSSWWNYPNHNSPFARIFMVYDGVQEVRFNGKTYQHKPGHIYIVPPFTNVDYLCNDSCTQFYLILSAELPGYGSIFQLDDIQFEFPITADIQASLRTLLNQVDNVPLQNYNPVSLIYSQDLQQAQIKMSPIDEWQITAIAQLLLTPFLQSLNYEKNESIFFNVTKYIEDNLHQQITLTDLAKQSNLVPSYFSDKFLEHFKLRPMAYLQNKRVEKAQLLLTTTHYNVDIIADMCGFKTSPHFCRVFKNVTALTPKRYRESLLVKTENNNSTG
ncbi:AraC family transcriptional regulator [Thalassotalea crassostreae]|uniref:AraC family transcriptional regulator n=1 Tax=Thalassotalea crassostreae TaxID=1763536 RepID=UPI0008396869|nr:AraC family transcriptional regulator [Thalassotalea crassostreae]